MIAATCWILFERSHLFNGEVAISMAVPAALGVSSGLPVEIAPARPMLIGRLHHIQQTIIAIEGPIEEKRTIADVTHNTTPLESHTKTQQTIFFGFFFS